MADNAEEAKFIDDSNSSSHSDKFTREVLAVTKAAELVAQATRIVVFTGAGMSVESGIPDFRSNGGLWQKFNPSIYANFQRFLQQPEDFWEMMQECAKLIEPAKPNAGHRALAELEKMGKSIEIVTQNIDSLHTYAGNSKVHELHGCARTAACVNCKSTYSLEEMKNLMKISIPPPCKNCGKKRVKPNVILFGESLPESVFENSMIAVQECEVLICIGSSLKVSPANLLPGMVKAHGGKLIIINLEATDIDNKADVLLKGKVGEVLPDLLALVKQKLAKV